MLQFLTPLWLLALPLAVLPWFLPSFRQPKQSSFLFSAFFLLPDQTRRKRFLFSLEDFILKLLRSMIIIILCLILARPFWQEEENTFTAWVVDDTFSRTLSGSSNNLSQYLQNLDSSIMNQPVWKLSELFPKSPYTPVQTQGEWDALTTASPNLSQIGSLLVKHLGSEKISQKLRIHLISDFQWSQFQFYQSATQKVEWVFHRPSDLETILNLSLRDLNIENVGLFEFQLFAEVYGFFPQQNTIQVEVIQRGQLMGTQKLDWQGQDSQKVEIRLKETFKRHVPIEVSISSEDDENILDNIRFYQWNRSNQLWVSIITSEGNTGIYRHGLHQLKSALNANRIFTFLSTALEDLKQHHPDVILLLGDHPIRWVDQLKEYSSKLFIPTRLGDWKSVSTQIHSSPGNEQTTSPFPEGQWVIDWVKVPFATEWKIQKINEQLYYSQTHNLWLLSTGVSPAWGGLYKDVVFADETQKWLKLLIKQEKQQYLGTFEAGSPLPDMIDLSAKWFHWTPGHYQIDDEKKSTYHFSINLPMEESQPHLMSEDQIDQMQQYFKHQSEKQLKQESIFSVNQLREWLLWGLLGFMFVEVLYLLRRIIKKSWRANGKHSFY